MGPNPSRRRGGFTLIEIMAVVLIIGLLSAMVGLAIVPQITKGQVTSTRTQLKNLSTALEGYYMDNGRFPTSEQGLRALIEPTQNSRNFPPGGYLSERRIPQDPWGNDYQYQQPGQHNTHSYDLWSLGADGAPGGSDADADIGNWTEDEFSDT